MERHIRRRKLLGRACTSWHHVWHEPVKSGSAGSGYDESHEEEETPRFAYAIESSTRLVRIYADRPCRD